MPIYKNKFFIILLILVILAVGYFLYGKNLISQPRASETLTIYNIDSRGTDGPEATVMPIRTVRWKTLPVAIYDQANLSYLQDGINEWNQAMGQEVFKIGGSDSPIIISINSYTSPVGAVIHVYHDYLLEKVHILINPEPNKYEKSDLYYSKDILKDKLGHALGFFGHTTSDADSVMDVDHTKNNTVITPFITSVLKELYKLPPGTRGVTNSALKKAVRKYTIDPQLAQYSFATMAVVKEFKIDGKLPEPQLPTRTMRWRSLPVAIYDKDNLAPDLKNIIAEWNQAMGQEVLKIGGSDSPIVIRADPKRPLAELVIWTPKQNYLLDKVQIINNPSWIDSNKIKHQLGHALGFIGHTTDDPEGIMDVDYNKQKTISPFVVSVLKELYRLPPGVVIIKY
jgi:hypothetical protein